MYYLFVGGFCVYKGKKYSPGQKWQDGCSYDCVCEDTQGNYKCTDKYEILLIKFKA